MPRNSHIFLFQKYFMCLRIIFKRFFFTLQEWLGYYEIARAEFPGAELVASTFDNFVAALEKVKSNLPVRSFEVGDTWIQGIASDPKKCAMYRAFVRTWENCSASGGCFLNLIYRCVITLLIVNLANISAIKYSQTCPW